MAVPVNRRVTLAARPVGAPQESDFALDEVPVGEPRPGEVLVHNLYVSVDPYQRGRMSEARSYAKPLELGDVVTAQGVGEVVESEDPRFSPGDTVVAQTGWQEYSVERAGSLRPVDSAAFPSQVYLHVLGTTGFTAYFGLLDVGRPRPGDTVVVSAAAGAVGQIVGQLAKIAGCRAVGIAGGPEKADDLGSLFGYDAAIDYKNEDVAARLREECPDGADIYFDNCGGEISAAVNRRLTVGGRIVVCGAVSTYNAEGPIDGGFDPRLLIVFRARMEGFLVSDYVHRFPEAAQRLARWLTDGMLRYQEDVTEGLENAPKAFIGMLNGENRGKALVKV
jgi:NADPH-dependent curcumin reductase CurA